MNTIALLVLFTTGFVANAASDDLLKFMVVFNHTADFLSQQCNKTGALDPCDHLFNYIQAVPQCELLSDMEMCIKGNCSNYDVFQSSVHKEITAVCCSPYLHGTYVMVILSTLVYFICKNLNQI
ncbi:hypothetical protein ElyMa_006478800 [Elysia marginata]|uniref:Uncharacterized protein n=1 Tax=Elysia marginata TaxID=1093978 RepID=A0AAV4I2C5_9GAST|nr:hypothetical protein ElyMa_006478800 [Elysia marginata]